MGEEKGGQKSAKKDELIIEAKSFFDAYKKEFGDSIRRFNAAA